MKITCVKMDKRFDGYPKFKYRANIAGNPVDKSDMFYKVVKWMTETYGHSTALDHHALLSIDSGASEEWAWKSESFGVYIYLKDEKIMQWFSLKWV